MLKIQHIKKLNLKLLKQNIMNLIAANKLKY